MPPTLSTLVPWGAAVGAAGVAILAGVAGLQARLLRWLLRRGAAPPVLALPAVWVSAELLLARAGPLSFPWTPLGLALSPVPSLAAPAEWGGAAVLSFWILAVNGALAGLWASSRRLVSAVLLLLLALPAVWGLHRVDRLPEREVAPLALVQLELSRSVLQDGELRDRTAGEALDRILSAAPPGVPVILPEAPFASLWEEGVRDIVEGWARRAGAPILAGARFREEGRVRNGVLLLDAEGRERMRHGKLRLVPAAEWPELTPGPDGGAAAVDGVRIGVLVCFESAFGSRSRSLVLDGAEVLVNPTIDAWFRPRRTDQEGGWMTAAHLQHRAHLVLRAVETRRGAVRSSVGGELLAVDASGRVRERRGPGREGLVTVRPRTTDLRTGFLRFGDAGGAAALLLLLGLLARAGRGSVRPGEGSARAGG